ncbi:MAG: phosphopyruvate hydratase [Candidatus Pacebacteria bacterium]|nr:phosphopyruvate hydratase [Candidatus Paceibacterota bacterium]
MEKYSISKILAEEIKDSRGNPTLKVTVWVGDVSDSFSVPSGASTGAHEAHELRDADGKGVNNAIEKVNKIIAGALVGKDVLNQKEIDRIMIKLDGTDNKDNLGGNSMIGVSIACAKVAALAQGIETYEHLRTLAEIKPSRKVPYLYMNLINGGKHAKNDLAFQEYHVVPDTENIKEAVEIGIKIQKSLKEIIGKELGEASLVLGDEGGYAPQISDIRKPLLYLTEAIKENNLEGKVRLALDVASSSFYKDGKYKVEDKEISKYELMDIYKSLIKEFNLLSIEDPFDEESFSDFKQLKDSNKNLFVVGDDLTVTNVLLLKEAIKEGSINAMIIKPNQIGTLTETLETMQLARENNIELIVSHRSGETNDDFIADLAFAFNCFGMKAGSPIKPERMVKYARLEKITNY